MVRTGSYLAGVLLLLTLVAITTAAPKKKAAPKATSCVAAAGATGLAEAHRASASPTGHSTPCSTPPSASSCRRGNRTQSRADKMPAPQSDHKKARAIRPGFFFVLFRRGVACCAQKFVLDYRSGLKFARKSALVSNRPMALSIVGTSSWTGRSDSIRRSL